MSRTRPQKQISKLSVEQEVEEDQPRTGYLNFHTRYMIEMNQRILTSSLGKEDPNPSNMNHRLKALAASITPPGGIEAANEETKKMIKIYLKMSEMDLHSDDESVLVPDSDEDEKISDDDANPYDKIFTHAGSRHFSGPIATSKPAFLDNFTAFPVDKQVKSLFGDEKTDLVYLMYDIARTIKFCLRHNDEESRSFAMYMFLRRLNVPVVETEVFRFAIEGIVKASMHVVVDPENIVTHALSDDIDSVGDVLEYTFDSAFADSVKTLVVCCAAGDIIPVHLRPGIYKAIGPAPAGPLYDIMRIGVKALARVVRTVEQVMAGEPLHEVLFAKDSWMTMKTLHGTLLFRKDYLYRGLPKEGLFPMVDWKRDASEVIKYLEGRMKMTSQHKKIYLDMSIMLTQMQAAMSEVMSAAEAVFRHMPFGLILGGDPKVGKSQLMSQIAYWWCEVKGYKFHEDLIFHRNPTTDFMDGLKQQPIGHWGEMGGETLDQAKREMSAMTAELTSIVDSVPKLANMADLKDKGKVWINFELIMADTNTPGLHFRASRSNPAAYARRFITLIPTVRKEFRVENGCGIDWEKCKARPDVWYMDRWTFRVYKSVPHNSKDYSDVDICTDVDIYELETQMKALFRAHIASQEYIEDIRRDDKLFKLPASAEEFKKRVLKTQENLDDVKTEMMEEKEVLPHVTVKERTKSSIREMLDDLSSVIFPREEGRSIRYVPRQFPNYDAALTDFIENGHLMEMTIGRTEYIYMDKQACADYPVTVDRTALRRRAEKLYGISKIFVWANVMEAQNVKVDDIKHDPNDDLHRDLKLLHIRPFMRPPTLLSTRDALVAKTKLYSEVAFMALKKTFSLFAVTTAWAWTLPFKGQGLYTSTCIQWTTTLLLAFIMFTAGFLSYPMFLIGITALGTFLKFKALCFGIIFDRYVGHKWRRFFTYFGIAVSDENIIWAVFSTKAALFLSLAGVVSYSLFPLFFRKTKEEEYQKPRFKKVYTQASDPLPPVKVGISVYEDEVLAGSSMVRRDMAGISKDWGYRTALPTRSKCPQGPEALSKIGLGNQRFCRIYYNEGRNTCIGKALGIRGDWCVINKHYLFTDKDYVEVEMFLTRNGSSQGESKRRKIYLKDFHTVGEDIALFRMYGQKFVDITDHLGDTDVMSLSGEASINGEKCMAKISENPICATHSPTGDTIVLNRYLVYDKKALKSGDCGSVISYQRDKGSAFVGIHAAGNSSFGFASLFDKKEVLRVIQEDGGILLESFSEPPCMRLVNQSVDDEVELSDAHQKSPFRYNALENIKYFGSYGSVSMKSKSKLLKSIFGKHPDFEENFYNAFGEFPSNRTGKPMMEPKVVNGVYINPYSIHLNKVNKTKKSLDSKILADVVDTLVLHILEGLEKEGITKLNPVTLDEAINGSEFDEYFRRVAASKSAGFAFPGSKSEYIPLNEDGKRHATPELEKLLCDVISTFKKKESVHFVYGAALKDEPRSLEKCANGNTRVFFVSPIGMLLLQRMFLSPFYTLMVQFPELFCCALGINMHRQGSDLRKRLSAFATKLMEGDYKGFDINMPFDIGLAAATVVCRVLIALGYNDFAVNVVIGLLNEGLHPYICMNGDIYEADGIQPSGKYATAEDNGLRGLLMLMYFWYWHPVLRELDFFQFVLAVLYGDDVVVAVKDDVLSYFNNNSYALFVKEHFGMEYTNASKGNQLKDYLEIGEISFLKRSWKYHAGLGDYQACLDVSSIFKTLEWRLPSTFVSESEQTIAMCDSALRESFFHLDENHYVSWREYLKSVLVETWPLLSDEINRRLKSYGYLLAYYGPDNDDYDYVEESVVYEDVCTESSMDTAYERVISQTILELEIELKEATSEYDSSVSPVIGLDHQQIKGLSDYSNNQGFRDRVNMHETLRSRVEEIEHALEQLRGSVSRRKRNGVYTESAEDGAAHVGKVDMATVNTRENVTDIGGAPDDVKTMRDSYDLSSITSCDMDSFATRPIRIATVTVPLATDVSQQLDVWQLLSNDPSLRARLRNYAFMRANIEITLDTAASPHHFGRVMSAYIPQPGSHDIVVAYRAASAANRYQFLQYLSQTSDCVIIDFKSNKPVVMKFPYLNFQPVCRLYNNITTSLGAGSVYNDLTDMGTLFIYTLNQLQASNATAATSATIYVYARFVDVKISGLTASQTAITTESAEEMKRGPLETYSSKMASTMGILEQVPIIRPYASIGNMIFTMTGRIAAIFGWSVPRVEESINPPSIVHNTPVLNNCVTIGRSTAQKMAFDPQQALSIDPRVVGVEEDELSIEYLTSINSLLDTFTWSTTSVPMSTILWQAAVCPTANKIQAAFGGRVFVQPTALSFVATLFDYWSGDIEYLFDFVCSMLHRGKVKIDFDPNICQYALITATPKMNKVHSLIVDLQETQRISVCVRWNFPKLWARTQALTQANRSVGTAFASPLDQVGQVNGFIYVTPLTVLQSPDSSPISVNVFVKGKNMRFNVADSIPGPRDRTFTQSGVEASYPETCFDINEPNLDTKWKSSAHFGEQPVSLRSYLRRFFTSYTSTVLSAATLGFSVRPLIFPDINPAWGATGVRINMYSYLRYAFLAMSGGVRKRINIIGASFSEMEQIHVRMVEPGSTTGTFALTGTTNLPESDLKGTVVTVPHTNGGLEIELPLYTNNMFLPSGKATSTAMKAWTNSNYDNFYTDSYYVEWYGSKTTPGTQISFVEDTAASEDFTLMRWIAAVPFSTASY